MNKELKVKGMHCNACVMLIRMELGENGLENNIESIELEDNNQGSVVLNNVEEAQLQEAKSTINKMDQYEVIDVKDLK